ncbi:MAG: cell division protein ZapA [Saccharofermentans sp.]|nr:cell division protein ZapA [Saccharofermentans sp.]
MKKSNTNNMFQRYSDSQSPKRKSDKNELPLMATYEQRYKGRSMARELTEAKPVQTLDEKIEARKKTSTTPRSTTAPRRVSVEIAGHNYLLGSTDNLSEARIRRIANKVNSILENTRELNPGLISTKITTLALLDACDKLITLQDENSNMKTELMYLQQKLSLEEKAHEPDPTPMEELANQIEEGKNSK